MNKFKSKLHALDVTYITNTLIAYKF